MKRVNRFRLRPTKEQEKVLFSLCEMSAVLWNKLNYIRRQAFFEDSIGKKVLMNYTTNLNQFWVRQQLNKS